MRHKTRPLTQSADPDNCISVFWSERNACSTSCSSTLADRIPRLPCAREAAFGWMPGALVGGSSLGARGQVEQLRPTSQHSRAAGIQEGWLRNDRSAWPSVQDILLSAVDHLYRASFSRRALFAPLTRHAQNPSRVPNGLNCRDAVFASRIRQTRRSATSHCGLRRSYRWAPVDGLRGLAGLIRRGPKMHLLHRSVRSRSLGAEECG